MQPHPLFTPMRTMAVNAKRDYRSSGEHKPLIPLAISGPKRLLFAIAQSDCNRFCPSCHAQDHQPKARTRAKPPYKALDHPSLINAEHPARIGWKQRFKSSS